MKTKFNFLNLELDKDSILKFKKGVKINSLLNSTEKTVIKLTMKQCKNNQSVAAKALGISRGTLRIKLEKYFGDKYFKNSFK